jgi:hypothetical protein
MLTVTVPGTYMVSYSMTLPQAPASPPYICAVAVSGPGQSNVISAEGRTNPDHEMNVSGNGFLTVTGTSNVDLQCEQSPDGAYTVGAVSLILTQVSDVQQGTP